MSDPYLYENILRNTLDIKMRFGSYENETGLLFKDVEIKIINTTPTQIRIVDKL